MGMRVDRVVRWTSQALKILFAAVSHQAIILILITPGFCFQDAVHITAILGESVVFNCHVEFPGDHPVPYVLQWEKKGVEIPIYIWYDSYPTHSGEGYEGRVSRVSPDSPYGLASLNLTDIRESDQGWYECKVVFLNRSPNQHKNGTWFHLDVHAPPRFSVTPEDIIYVNLGDAIILNCQAEGTPTPEILWYKDANPVEPSATIGIFNDGTELRISNIRHEDIGDYTCIARNGEGQISHTARVIIAGGAVIMVPPTNQTKLEGEKVQFTCEAKALPGNVTVKWLREGVPIMEVAALETRVTTRRDGSLIVNPVNADDSGLYTCEVSNGIGEPQSASAYLNVEFPAKVTFTPTVQYLPFRLAGVVQCFIKANPPLQYVTWTKDKRLLEPYQTKDIVIMNNGSLLFTRVNQNHQGRYTCTPYNAQGTQGSSGAMEVLVRKPPVFTVEPESLYQRKVGETVEMHCDAQEAEGTQKPTIQWQRRDGAPLQKNRVRTNGGNITIESLRRSDFGFYQCVASNEVATIVTATQLVVEGTQPHAPYNVSGNSSEFAVTLSWLPGYSGGPDYKQDYTIWYREAGASDWSTIPVTPSGSTQVTINRLTPGTTYEFQVVGKNALGDGMLSKVITVRTQDVGITRTVSNPVVSEKDFVPAPEDSDIFDQVLTFPTDSTGATLIPPILKPKGPRPGPPKNLTVTEIPNGFLISWEQPSERANLVLHYTIKYRTDAQWKTLNKGTIRPEETQYLVKNLVGGRTYYFRVLANSRTSYESSEELKFSVPARVKHKAIKAGVVGGFLFFIVAIILSVCAVKICNKRKRRRQEKAYNMVACRITDGRNGGQLSGAMQVPLKNLHGEGRISSLIRALKSVSSRVPDWNGRVQGDGEDFPDGQRSNFKESKRLGRITRSADGRFVVEAPDNRSDKSNGGSCSSSSSSDDGGFLSRRNGFRLRVFDRASWRRPLVAYPSELSLRSDGTGQSYLGEHSILKYLREKSPSPSIKIPGSPMATSTSSVIAYGRRRDTYSPSSSTTRRFPPKSPSQMSHSSYSQRLTHVPAIYPARGFLYCDRPDLSLAPIQPATPKFYSSSPVHSNGKYSPFWSPKYDFSDLSSVPVPSSAERSFPDRSPGQRPNYVQLKNVHQRYARELPSLRAIHEETFRLPREAAFFVPVQPSPPRIRIPSQWNDFRAKARLPPRHLRQARSAPELTLGHEDSAISTGFLAEASPESRSSSSGFGSKNTSSQQNQSSQSGSTTDWRFTQIPFVRGAPPSTREILRPSDSISPRFSPEETSFRSGDIRPPPSTISDWYDFATDICERSPSSDLTKMDASVDGHYEFDAVFSTTPTPPIPISISYSGKNFSPVYGTSIHYAGTYYPLESTTANVQKSKRIASRYDNIEARVQAMKEEYYAFRRRQEKRKRTEELERTY